MDSMAQFLTLIRNAGFAKHEKVDVPASKFRIGVAKILEEQGYIRSFKVAKDSKQGIMRIYLKYDSKGSHVISSLDKISTPGRRVYVKYGKIPKVRSGKGLCILSTSRGVVSGNKAEELKLGGELICTVW